MLDKLLALLEDAVVDSLRIQCIVRTRAAGRGGVGRCARLIWPGRTCGRGTIPAAGVGTGSQLYYLLLELGEGTASDALVFSLSVRLPSHFAQLMDAYWLLDNAVAGEPGTAVSVEVWSESDRGPERGRGKAAKFVERVCGRRGRGGGHAAYRL